MDTYSQNILLSGNKFSEEKKYWLEKLSGAPRMGGIPADYPYTVKYNKGILSDVFSESLSEKLNYICNRSENALYIFLLTGSIYLFHRYSYEDETDIIVGMPGVKKAPGSLEEDDNISPLRIITNGEKSFKELLLKVKTTVAEARKYKNIPFSKIVELLDLKFDNEVLPHFKTIILLENIHSHEPGEKVKADSIFAFEVASERIKVTFKYNTYLFAKEKAKRVLVHLVNILAAAANDPGISLNKIAMLSEEEQAQLLYDYNDTNAEYPKDKTIHQLFEEQVKKTPDRIALVGADLSVGQAGQVRHVSLTYSQLNEQANKLAGILIGKDVLVDDIVAIMMERSVEMIIGVIGILKAGGAYLPIDPDYPQERIDFMLKDSGAKLLAIANGLEGEKVRRWEGEKGSSNLAYIIYTSGSTGKPKGVMIQHRSVVNYICWAIKQYIKEENVRFPLFTSLSFDLTVTSIFVPLLSGNAIVIYPGKGKEPIIERVINDNLVDVMKVTPSHLKLILEFIKAPFQSNIKRFIVGGEALGTQLAGKVAARFNNNIVLYNEYGPTEATVGCMIYQYCPGKDTQQSVPIGIPAANTQIYILDKRGEPVTIGVTGELYISGDGLARGYLNRPELTAERFKKYRSYRSNKTYIISFYKTGDLARWLNDGNIEFLGRTDYQVKIRGFRVELGEIENRLLSYPGMKEALVLSWKEKDDNESLCAYTVTDKDYRIPDLREFLLKELPDYMVPSYFVQLKKMPLTPNGKIDRSALPRPELNIGENYKAPRNEIEEKLVKLWAEILGRDSLHASQLQSSIGINDNFFQLGGQSIKAVQLAAILQKDFDVSLADIFQYQTISSLAPALIHKKSTLQERIEKLKSRINPISVSQEILNLRKVLEGMRQTYRVEIEKYRNIELSERVAYHSILLTGVTGFLGIHLLAELLDNSNAHIYLFIRGKSHEEAEQRLLGKIKFYFNETLYETYRSRIHTLNGNIAYDHFGLVEKEYNFLAGEIDCIINSAAFVKHYGFYNDILQVNAEGVRRLIEFAFTGKKKDLNHISTVSIASGKVRDQRVVLFSEFDHNFDRPVDNLYLQTKVMGERYIEGARERGLNASIFRIGNLVFHSETGKFQENIEDNAFYSLLRAFIKIGIMIGSISPVVDFSFIDQVSKTVVLLYDRQALRGETHHLFNSNRISLNDLARMLSELGESLRAVPVDEFLNIMLANYEKPGFREYIEMIILHTNPFSEFAGVFIENISERTDLLLSRLGYYWPKVNINHVEKMLSYCKQVGFI